MKKILALTSILAFSGILYSCGSSSSTEASTKTVSGDITSLYDEGLIDLLNSDYTTKGITTNSALIRDVIAKVTTADNITKYYDGYFYKDGNQLKYIIPGLPTSGTLQIVFVNQTVDESAPTKGEITTTDKIDIIKKGTIATTPPINLETLNDTTADQLNITNIDPNTKSAILPSTIMKNVVENPFEFSNTTLQATSGVEKVMNLNIEGDNVFVLKTLDGFYLLDETNTSKSASITTSPVDYKVINGKLYLVYKNGNEVTLNETNITLDNSLKLNIEPGVKATLNNNETIRLLLDNDTFALVGENQTLNVGSKVEGSDSQNVIAPIGSFAFIKDNTINLTFEPILNATLAVDNSTDPMTANVTVQLNNNLTLINDTVSLAQGTTTNETLAQVNITTKVLGVKDSKIRALAIVSYNITATNDADTSQTNKTLAFLLNIDPSDISNTQYNNIILYNTNETLNVTPAAIQAYDDENIYFVALNTTKGSKILKLDFENNTITDVTDNYNDVNVLVNLMENNKCMANNEGEIFCIDDNKVYYYNQTGDNKILDGQYLSFDINKKKIYIVNNNTLSECDLNSCLNITLPSGLTYLSVAPTDLFGNITNSTGDILKLYYYSIDLDNQVINPPVWYEFNITAEGLNITSSAAVRLDNKLYLVNNTGYFYLIKVK